MTTLDIVQCGPGASVQDVGRLGYRRLGVSSAGAMDRRTLALANALVGNAPGAAGVELALAGATFTVSGGPLLVAACGPGTTMTLSGSLASENTSAMAMDGETIKVGPARDGMYAYLAVAGGIRTPPVLGSRSFHRRSGIGGDLLSPGDRLPCVAGRADTPMRVETGIRGTDDAIRIVPGPQDAFFAPDVWATFLSERYSISARSDRMGLRLDGPALRSARGHDITSEGVAPGSIQVPGDGNPIVLGRDCQTTGGYPKIATVISADLDRLAQIPIGQELRFRVVSVDAAIEAARAAARWIDGLQTAARPVGHTLPNLLAHNLIGGVTRGDDI